MGEWPAGLDWPIVVGWLSGIVCWRCWSQKVSVCVVYFQVLYRTDRWHLEPVCGWMVRGGWSRGLVPGRGGTDQDKTSHLLGSQATGVGWAQDFPPELWNNWSPSSTKQSSFYLKSNVLHCIFDIIKFNHSNMYLLSTFCVAGTFPGSGITVVAHHLYFIAVRITQKPSLSAYIKRWQLL